MPVTVVFGEKRVHRRDKTEHQAHYRDHIGNNSREDWNDRAGRIKRSNGGNPIPGGARALDNLKARAFHRFRVC